MSRLLARWRGRVAGGVVLAAIGYGLAVALDFDPRPLPYVVWAVVVLAMTYLVVDTVDVPAAQWRTGPPPADRVDEVTSDLRILTSHRSADHPSDALARRLVELARARDPGLAEEIQHETTDGGRLSPGDIDRILTRIEDLRDRR
ncbi:hypothetical protein [Nocardioides sp. zg-1228]|uniref:hypothetical protein n=1 Tax=Nocardioides sp. zg-1228 TaxID=2763008 RepID=UPI001642C251|nr:hypothetical protein [Nocardioides sp. zg-1228]MBC2933910.1 hypothetical protein [Nocardioides sp. zg-1228]QSF58675.1 hypothetical protein JX575_05645 [Nocardioides sp. zg-1228]